MSSVRSVMEMMDGRERSPEIPENVDRPEALMTKPESLAKEGAVVLDSEAPTGTTELKISAAAPEAVPARLESQRGYATRSRKSVGEEQRLEKELARSNGLKRDAEDTLAGLMAEKQRALNLLRDGQGWGDQLLSATLAKIVVGRDRLAAFTEIAAKAQSNLDAFRAYVAAYAPERARIQDYLAALAAARLEIDFELERHLRQALETLKLREDVIDLMHREAARIELICDLKGGVPPSLHEALSLEIVAASKTWNAQFLGDEENLKAYVVCDDFFEPKETLARRALYLFGETVFLLEEEACEFLRDDRPQPGGQGWETLPPSLMTAEAFAAVKAKAGPIGKLMKYVVRQKHDGLQQKRRVDYLEERRGTPVPGVDYHFAG